jgi:hypothetical protein
MITARDRRQLARERARRRVRRERQIAACATIAIVLLAGAVFALSRGGSGGESSAAAASKKPPPPPQLPRGGRTLLPTYRVVAYYGAPGSAQLGQLGIGRPDAEARRLAAQAAPYARGGRPLQPAFELIATVVTAAPGSDGRYRYRQSDAVIQRYLAAARRAKALLVLDIQPGRSPFMDEVRAFEPYLRQPDVGLALDPEWSMRRGQVPGSVIGSTDASVINRAGAYLARIVKQNDLPQKLLIVHQFTPQMIRHKRRLEEHPGVALVINIDGFGNPPNKISKYRLFARRHPPWYNGFKLFYHEDTDMMSPRAVLRLHPRPDVIIYE